MRIQLIKESSGLCFNGTVANWIVESIENVYTIEKLKNGQIVDIPDRIAVNIYNVVDVETGDIISKKYYLTIPVEQVKQKYQSMKEVESIKTDLKKIFPLDGKIKEINEEIKL